jgi:lipoprotein NlpI
MIVTPHRLLVPMTLLDKQVHMVVDTGGFWSLIDQPMVDELKLKKREVKGVSMVDGAGRRLNEIVTIPRSKIGGVNVGQSLDFVVAPTVLSGVSDGGIAESGSIGAHFLSEFDVELDISKGKLGLFRHEHCEGRVVYWTNEPYGVVNLRQASAYLIEADVEVDGHNLEALLDTGSPTTTMSLEVAKRKFNLHPGSPGVQLAGTIRMASGAGMEAYSYTFKALKLGEVTFYNVPMMLAPINRVEMILGLNELKKMHLYLAYSEMKMYVTPAEGAPPPPPKVAGGGGLDAVLKNGAELYQKGEYRRALAEFDRAVRLYPKHPSGYLARASVYAKLGHTQKQIDDLSEAIHLLPDEGSTYLSRGTAFLAIRRYPEAERDLRRSAELLPSMPYGHILLHLARIKMGRERGDDLKIFAKKIDRTSWPAPVVNLLLGLVRPDQVRSAAARGDSDHLKDRQCEAEFYIGQYEQNQGNTALAKALFEKSVQICPDNFVEYFLALAELKSMNMPAH